MKTGVTLIHVLILTLTEQYQLLRTTTSATSTTLIPFLKEYNDSFGSQEDLFFSVNPLVDKLLQFRRADGSASNKLEHADCILEVLSDVKVDDRVVSDRALQERDFFQNHLAGPLDSEKSEDRLADLVKSAMSNHIHVKSASIRFKDTVTDLTVYRKGSQILFSRMPVSYENPLMAGWTSPRKNCHLHIWLFGFTIKNTHAESQLTIYFELEELRIDVNQCDPTYKPLLKFPPNCDQFSTECRPVPNSGFVPGGFQCICRRGFYFSHQNSSQLDSMESLHRCLRCPLQCSDFCTGSGNCSISNNITTLRATILSVQLIFMLVTSVLVVIIFKTRKCKTVAAGMWTILEIILFGCIILYGTVLVRWFSPSTEVCLIEPWCREIGFVVCYGAIILKLYRILIEFRTRKAHRWVVRDKDLLKYLLGMVIVVFGYMSAWTAMNLNLIQYENYSMLTIGTTDDGLGFPVCKSVWWDYVTETGEMLILVFGMHLSYASRNAKSQFQERRFLFVAIAIEAFISGLFYILRFLFWASMDADTTLLIYFIRSQLTTSIIIIVIFAPKWWYQQFEVKKCKVSRHYLTQESGRGPFEAFKPQGVSATNSDVEVEVNLAEMNPDDIRAELKRLYTQLEVLKNKTIRFDNPHISKRRGGRKIAHRRFSLQALKHQSQKTQIRNEQEPTEAEHSRTPEDSICSNEGPSVIMNDGPSEVLHSTPKKQSRA